MGNFLLRRLGSRLAGTRFARKAVAERADLGAMRAKPTPRLWTGLGLMAFSYVIGWPAVALLAWISYRFREPLVVIVGGPAAYGLSHLVFLAGFYLAGVHYAQILMRWAARRLVEGLSGPPESAGALAPLEPSAKGLAQGAGKATDVPAGHGGWERPSPAFLVGTAAFVLSCLLLPLRPVWMVAPLGLFVMTCLVAPFLPGVGFFLPVISRHHTDRRVVALTFDDGPDPDVTPRLLELLRRHGVRGTFFVSGIRAERHPGVVREILSRGHALGNHSYRHDPLLMLRSTGRLREEIALAQKALAALDVRPLAFRPPVGITNPRLPGVLKELGMYCLTFSCRAWDRGNRRINGLAAAILKKVRPGDIVLLHDVTPKGGEGAGQWIAEADAIVSGLKAGGYEILSLEELIGRPVMERLSVHVPRGDGSKPAPSEGSAAGSGRPSMPLPSVGRLPEDEPQKKRKEQNV